MLQCDLDWYLFPVFRDWITEREQDGRYARCTACKLLGSLDMASPR
jgi:hypothetical protein